MWNAFVVPLAPRADLQFHRDGFVGRPPKKYPTDFRRPMLFVEQKKKPDVFDTKKKGKPDDQIDRKV